MQTLDLLTGILKGVVLEVPENDTAELVDLAVDFEVNEDFIATMMPHPYNYLDISTKTKKENQYVNMGTQVPFTNFSATVMQVWPIACALAT